MDYELPLLSSGDIADKATAKLSRTPSTERNDRNADRNQDSCSNQLVPTLDMVSLDSVSLCL